MMKNNTNMMVSQHPHQFNQHSVYESDEHDGIESICSCTINMGYMNDQPEKQVDALPQMASSRSKLISNQLSYNLIYLNNRYTWIDFSLICPSFSNSSHVSGTFPTGSFSLIP